MYISLFYHTLVYEVLELSNTKAHSNGQMFSINNKISNRYKKSDSSSHFKGKNRNVSLTQLDSKYVFRSNYTQKYIEKTIIDVNHKKKENKKSISHSTESKNQKDSSNNNSHGSEKTQKMNIEVKKKENKREQSYKVLVMSDVLTVKERMIFVKAMNKKEHNKMKKKVLTSYNKSLTKQKEQIEHSLTFTPSKIAQNCLNFITQQDESQYIELLSNDINDALPKELITQIKDQLIIILMLIKSDKDNIRSIYSQSVKDLYLNLQSRMTLLKINNISK